MSKKMVILISAAALAAAGATGGWLYWRASERAAILADALPPAPDLSAQPAPLRQRVSAAQTLFATSPEEALAELSRLYHANGFYQEAARCYAILAQLQPGEPRWPHLHACILAGYGDTDSALSLWQRTVALAPTYAPAGLRLGDLYLKRNDTTSADKVYRTVLSTDPNNHYAQLGIARCLYDSGRWDSARVLLEPLVVKTEYILGPELLTTTYEKLGMEEQARSIRARSKAATSFRDPTDPWLDQLGDDCYDVYQLTVQAGAAKIRADSATAYRRLEQAFAIAPDQPTVLFQLAGFQLQDKMYSKARDNFEKCTRLQPTFSDGWLQLSMVQDMLGDSDQATATLAAGLRACPTSPALHLQTAQRLSKSGRVEEALPAFRESIRLRPNEADAYLGLATALTRLGRTPEAMEAFNGALVAEPEHPMALIAFAHQSITSGNEMKAMQWLRRVYAQPRTDREARQTLSSMFRKQFGRDFQQESAP
jgi:tetratricopeptide (TPR) repeat protein